MGIMSGSNLPKSGMFYADCVRNEICIKLPEIWHQIPVFDKGNKQMFGGKWTQYFFDILNKSNIYCNFTFRKNYIKKKTQESEILITGLVK